MGILAPAGRWRSVLAASPVCLRELLELLRYGRRDRITRVEVEAVPQGEGLAAGELRVAHTLLLAFELGDTPRVGGRVFSHCARDRDAYPLCAV